ncbi:MAG: class I SAM-dependent methyltransferase [Cyanosarcina radialis HA8281-LM2]|jgi:predicted TPR repeat methyltransferase|nr:class I SAM-dependent methyltransferase [Cyanosarcina radialis HA8281-LM2]
MNGLLRKPMENYQGCHIGCAPGTHAGLTGIITRHVKPRSGVLDIGAHAGALLRRLQDAGFSDLTGTDLDTTRFNCPGAQFKRLELNQPFSTNFERKFHLITSTDVIEHLDNPRNFLTESRKLLEDDGWLAISLPNVAFWEGRVKFLLKGELWGFGEKNYRSQRHISPITFEQMVLMMQEIGLQVIEVGTAGSFATPLRMVITSPVWGLLKLMGGNHVLGESALFLAKKVDPDPDLKRPTHYRNRWEGVADQIGIDAEKVK